MKPKTFLNLLQHDDIVAAIKQAEAKTSGEIRVFISRKNVEDPVIAAQEQFVKMGMTKTREKNGVLIFVAPEAHKFAVLGDSGIHAKCGQEFWDSVTQEMTAHFKRDEFSEGVIRGITKAAEILARHFPRDRDDQNELPDEVEHD